MHNPFLIGDNFYLRSLELDDLKGDYAYWLNDTTICAGNSHAIFPTTLDSLKSFIIGSHDQKNAVILAIISKNTDKHIGNISIQNINWIARSGEFAILIGNKEYWGKNAGYEAGQLICQYAIKKLNLRRIYCGTLSNNIGMQKLAEKLGMELEGVRKQAIYKEGCYLDILEYGIVFEGI